MKFENGKMKKRYRTYRSYLSERCEVLAGTLERKYASKFEYVNHHESRQRGMSNYLLLTPIATAEDEFPDEIKIRISDHCNYESIFGASLNIYVQNKTWKEIKDEIIDFVETL